MKALGPYPAGSRPPTSTTSQADSCRSLRQHDWIKQAQVAYEGFAAAVWTKYWSGYIDDRTDIGDKSILGGIGRLGVDFAISFASAYAKETIGAFNGTKTYSEALSSAYSSAVIGFVSSKSFDKFLSNRGIKNVGPAKVAIIAGIRNGGEALGEIFLDS